MGRFFFFAIEKRNEIRSWKENLLMRKLAWVVFFFMFFLWDSNCTVAWKPFNLFSKPIYCSHKKAIYICVLQYDIPMGMVAKKKKKAHHQEKNLINNSVEMSEYIVCFQA